MYAVRLHFKNGQMLSYLWNDMDQAHKLKDLVARAMIAGNANPPRPDGAVCEFWDGARNAHVDGTDLMAVQLVSIADEVTNEFEAALFAEQIKQKMLIQHGLAQPAGPAATNQVSDSPPPPRQYPQVVPSDSVVVHLPPGGIARFEG